MKTETMMSDNSIDFDDRNLTEEEASDLEEMRNTSSAISYRSQDFDVAGLVRRLESDDIVVPRIGSKANRSFNELNCFQRGFVWSKKQMDSFIESLLLEYPIPALFFVRQSDRRLIVLDGQQRLETLRRYYSGMNGEKKYRLCLPGSPFNNCSYDELPDRYRRILDNTYITTTVILLDNTAASHDAVYDVFARLNSGGTQLTPHEIRMALYNGKLMDLIDELNLSSNWRILYGSTVPNKRFRDHELILRIVALYLCEDSYSKPLGKFLNSFCEQYRGGSNENLIKALRLFERAIDLISASGFSHSPFSQPGKSQLNTARADSIVVALMHALEGKTSGVSSEAVLKMIDLLNGNAEYVESVTSATSDDAQVHKRIRIARELIENVG